MKVGKTQLETLLNDLTLTGGTYTACIKDLCTTCDIMHVFNLELTLQETAARLLIVILDTPTLTLTDVEVVIRGHALTLSSANLCYTTVLLRHLRDMGSYKLPGAQDSVVA